MHKRNPNIFEKILLLVGVLIVIIGYSFVHRIFILTGQVLTWDLLQAMFLWLVLAVLLILLAVTENVKEELRVLIEQHLEEIKLLREDVSNSKKGRRRT